MSARVQTVALLVFGVVLVRLASGAAFARYVRPGTRPLVFAAGVLLVLTAAAAAVLCRTREGAASPRFEYPHGLVTRAAWLLLAPAITIAVVAPPALGVLTANRAPVAPPRPASGFAHLPHAGVVPIALSDVVLRTVWHAGGTLHGRTLRVLGFVARASPHGFVLARLVITCCAADARPYDIEIRGASRPPPPGRWVKVTGVYLGDSSVPDVPAMQARTVRTTPAPADPYG